MTTTLSQLATIAKEKVRVISAVGIYHRKKPKAVIKRDSMLRVVDLFPHLKTISKSIISLVYSKIMIWLSLAASRTSASSTSPYQNKLMNTIKRMI